MNCGHVSHFVCVCDENWIVRHLKSYKRTLFVKIYKYSIQEFKVCLKFSTKLRINKFRRSFIFFLN